MRIFHYGSKIFKILIHNVFSKQDKILRQKYFFFLSITNRSTSKSTHLKITNISLYFWVGKILIPLLRDCEKVSEAQRNKPGQWIHSLESYWSPRSIILMMGSFISSHVPSDLPSGLLQFWLLFWST